MTDKWETYVHRTSAQDVLKLVQIGHDIMADEKSSIAIKRNAVEFIRGLSLALVAKAEQDLKDAEAYAIEWAGIPHGYRPSTDNDMDGGQLWWCFPASFSDDEIVEKLENNWYRPRGYWNGAGLAFAHGIFIERHKTRVIVTQSVGFDI